MIDPPNEKLDKPVQLPPRGRAILIPIVVGGLAAILTVNFDYLPNGTVWNYAFPLLFPGVFGAMLIGNTLHNANLWLAGAINGLIYFGVAWTLRWALTGLAKERKWRLPHFR